MGSYPSVSLAKARSKAAQARERLGDGLDPKLVLIEHVVSESTDIPEAVITFRQAMDRYLQLRSGEWSNAKRAKRRHFC
ncbi:MAG: integrase arm-type DNA-binding domain-containing protein [Tateyamaria sp.]|nr:integrase arm-type DNA-binding domain-containing protein [Tateyamaria sp.]